LSQEVFVSHRFDGSDLNKKMKAAQISKPEQMHSGKVRFRVVLTMGV
jgi:hypothetical protein